MTTEHFEENLVNSAFALAGEKTWAWATPAAAARRAGLDEVEARATFPRCGGIVARFGEMEERYALTGALTEGPVRDRLFDILMRRFDFLQLHRPGVLALLRFLPLDPPLALLLARANLAALGRVLEAAGVPATGLRGALRKRGLALVWAYAVHAWTKDESADLAHTMAALDHALDRADLFAARFDSPVAVAPPSPSPGDTSALA
ncbi:MAG: TetR family transcriptional regulator [Acidocella sp. 20-63-7]|nr:MAG: TetR family transcriptional regulator [Acidocella sp. 20-63-7]HQT47604.1 TetR family transcriptional regulator [Acidocella sp.]